MTLHKLNPYAVTAISPSPDAKSVKVPRSREENRTLKAGHVEDDNEDIAYLNFSLLWPVGITSALSLGFFALALGTMEMVEHLSFERFALNQLLYSYGKTKGFCNNTFPYEEGMMPSFLRQVEMKVLSNIFLRIAVCTPMAIRIFVAFIIRNSIRDQPLTRGNPFFHYFNEISGVVVAIEVLSLGMFSIVTIRFDYPDFYNAMFGTFIASATAYMFLRTILSFVPEKGDALEQFATLIRLLCTILFTWTASQVFKNHQVFIKQPGCHGYVSPSEAITEYIAIFSYLLFQLCQLVDIRDIRFICYPRTCSGECEPLRPENFIPTTKDGTGPIKYQHCRAYEHRQRQMMEEVEGSGGKGKY